MKIIYGWMGKATWLSSYKLVSKRRYRHHTRLAGQGREGEIEKVTHGNSYVKGIPDLGDLRLGWGIVVKYRFGLSNLWEELVMIQKIDDFCTEEVPEHAGGLRAARPSLNRPVALHCCGTQDTKYTNHHHELDEGKATVSLHSVFPMMGSWRQYPGVKG